MEEKKVFTKEELRPLLDHFINFIAQMYQKEKEGKGTEIGLLARRDIYILSLYLLRTKEIFLQLTEKESEVGLLNAVLADLEADMSGKSTDSQIVETVLENEFRILNKTMMNIDKTLRGLKNLKTCQHSFEEVDGRHYEWCPFFMEKIKKA
jgi:hypothetical protein